ncbi:MAG: glutamine synthetase III [Bacilli bacterium]|nr:glutamine synthetase III [Bacilli bacterium]
MEKKLTELYGSYTFNDDVMKERLPKETYKAFHDALDNGETMSKDVATIIAEEMKNWAIEKGATHFTHWFSPLTGLSAEKHDAFLEPKGNKAILEFTGKLLRKGEPDASSFPSGGLRATFEARGYTSWDCTSPAFIKNDSLYIPTLFCSYTGEALDNKTPLLKSLAALNKQATRLLPLLGVNEVSSVTSNVGAEQEYFLVSEEHYKNRLDLKITGRTLFGAKPPKGQEMDDHYFGSINEKVSKFMKELDYELWKYGIPAKTKHNEAAPCQHELACVYRDVNTTTDNNQLIMQVMQDIAKKNGLRCLLHEKPFKGVNGSGKHNNWSVTTNTGINLFKPTNDPLNNIPFLATLACIVKGVDEYADLLRLAIATPSNDHRLGGNEAPPVIMSIFTGEALETIIDCVIENKTLNAQTRKRFKTGVSIIPDFTMDNSDRNRTSPFAFTGNKFEFRGVGSSQTIAYVNTILNSILAFEMKEMADLIESGKKPLSVIRSFLKEHKRIIFNGDGYSASWKNESLKRGLPSINNSVDAFLAYKNEKVVNLFKEVNVHNDVEINSRYEILLETYCKSIHVEALTALKMAKTEIYPATINYLNKLANASSALKANDIDNSYLLDDVKEFSSIVNKIKSNIILLEENINKAINIKDNQMKANIYKNDVIKAMNDLREVVDEAESKVDKKDWPMPTYVDLLYEI